jgi:hypothetical protein
MFDVCKRRTNRATGDQSYAEPHAVACLQPASRGAKTHGKPSVSRMRPRAGARAAACVTKLWFWRKWWRPPPAGLCTSVSRSRIRFVALCVGLVTDAAAAVRDPAPCQIDGHACAASFLKHKLWRIRNTAHLRRIIRWGQGLQVIDQPALCTHGCKLARLLLVVEQNKGLCVVQDCAQKYFHRGALINEDESGCCLGSR